MCAGRGYVVEQAMCLIAGFLLPVRHCVRTSSCMCQKAVFRRSWASSRQPLLWDYFPLARYPGITGGLFQ
jgi:hypothetical protein